MGEILVARTADGAETRYLLEVAREADHWVSTLSKLAASGEVESAKVAPRFYGTSEQQARRRMVTVLENQYEEVSVEPE